MEAQDTEITLGTGKLLGLFMGLVVVCAVFFGLGFVLGRNSGSPAPVVQGTAAPIPVATSVAKPTAGKGNSAPAEEKSTTDELAFVKAGDKPSTPDPAPASEEPATAPPIATAPASKPAPEMKPAAAAAGSGFVVQVAAVSKKDDADALLGALRKKSYPVFVASDAGDHLFHVQVGPFTDRKDAQTMKDKLAGDGYNAIVK